MQNYKVRYAILAIATFLTLSSYLIFKHRPQSYCAKETTNPKYHYTKISEYSPIFVWDFHDVIVRKQKWPMATRLWDILAHAHNKWALIKLMINPYFWADVSQLRQESDVLDGVIDKIITKHQPLLEHKEKIIDLINLHNPISQTIDLIKSLKDLGYKNYIASNIGERSYKIMAQRHPDIFALFDDVYFVGKKNNAGIDYCAYAKPHYQYYQGLRAFLADRSISLNSPIIFIDDKEINIKGALNASVGIDAILFISPEELLSQFQKRGIVVPQNENNTKKLLLKDLR